MRHVLNVSPDKPEESKKSSRKWHKNKNTKTKRLICDRKSSGIDESRKLCVVWPDFWSLPASDYGADAHWRFSSFETHRSRQKEKVDTPHFFGGSFLFQTPLGSAKWTWPSNIKPFFFFFSFLKTSSSVFFDTIRRSRVAKVRTH